MSVHQLTSYVAARRDRGFEDAFPTVYDWVLSQVGAYIEPRLKQSSPYRKWSMIHDLFKHSGITSFNTTEILKNSVNEVCVELGDERTAR